MKNLSKAVLLAVGLIVLIALPVLAYNYRATYTITENASTTYTMLPVKVASKNSFMASNGFMNSNAMDTRVETLSGVAKPHMVTDNEVFVAIPISANSQTNLYFTTGSSNLSNMNIITGYGGNLTVTDAPELEWGNNYNFALAGLLSINSTLYHKDSSASINYTSINSTTGNITARLYEATNPAIVSNVTTAENISTTSHNFTLPTHNSSDLLIVMISSNPVTVTYTTPAGWTLLRSTTGANVKLTVWYKVSDGTEGTWLAATSSLLLTDAVICYRIANAGVPTDSGTATATSTAPNSSSLNVSGNITGKVWLSFFAGHGASVASPTVLPTNYTGNIDQAATTAGGNFLSMVSTNRTFISTVDDPSAYTVNATQEWIADTITVPGLDIVLAASNVVSVTQTTITGNSSGSFLYANSVLKSSNTSSATIIDNANNITMFRNIACSSNITLSANGTEVFWYSPNDMIHGTVLPDRTSLNLITNGSFESGNPPTGWSLAGGGSTWSQASSIVKYGSYSGNYTRAGSDTLVQKLVANPTSLAGDTLTFGSWVYATVASRARIGITDDSATTFNLSSYHTGSGTWEFLTTTVTVSGTTNLRVLLQVANGDTSAYFDGASLVVGSTLASTFPIMDGIGDNATINYGANPVGVNVTLGNMVSTSQPTIGQVADQPNIDILPQITVSNPNGQPAVGGSLQLNPFHGLVVIMTGGGTGHKMSESQAWRFFGLLFVLVATIWAAIKTKGNFMFTGIACGVAIGAVCALTIWPPWALAFAIVTVIAGFMAQIELGTNRGN